VKAWRRVVCRLKGHVLQTEEERDGPYIEVITSCARCGELLHVTASDGFHRQAPVTGTTKMRQCFRCNSEQWHMWLGRYGFICLGYPHAQGHELGPIGRALKVDEPQDTFRDRLLRQWGI